MLAQLPPTGDAVVVASDPSAESALDGFFSPYRVRLFGSGAAALAAALLAVCRRANKSAPEILLPAYACPEVVSAVLYAGAKPVPVDLDAQSPRLSLDAVSAALNANTIAIVAIHLFGMRERVAELQARAASHGVVVVEDSAQAFPLGEASSFWTSDIAVVSFGRGKPVSVLGGGAVLYRVASWATELAPQSPQTPSIPLAYRIKAQLYNALRWRFLYWIPQALPFLKLGATHFHEMYALAPAPAHLSALLPINIRRYRARTRTAQMQIAEMLQSLSANGVVDPAAGCNDALVRYPVLMPNRAARDRALVRLRRAGLGATALYRTVLPQIAGLEQRLADAGPFPVAQDFAARLLTLPTHEDVTATDVVAMGRCLQASVEE